MQFLEYIYFFYGLAFFLFGFSILHYPKENSIFKFAHHLTYLGLFGILHGISEWLVMFQHLEEGSTAVMLAQAGFVFMTLSYATLLFFAVTAIWEQKTAAKTVLLLSLVWTAAVIAADQLTFTDMDILVRYLIGVPAIFLTAYIFSHPDYIVQRSVNMPFRRCMYTFAGTFFVYGILAGLIVPPGTFFPASVLNAATFESSTGLPVQLFRAICAIIASHSIGRILLIFKNESELRLLKLSSALQESGDTVVITDTDGNIEYTNRAFEKQTGFLAHEIIGNTPKILRSGEHPQPFYENLWNTILSGDIYQGVLVNKKKDGTYYHEFKTIVPLKSKKGKITNFISTGKDITSRVTFEKELAQAAQTDPLTKAFNRLQCDRCLRKATEQARLNGTGVTLIMFDIDDFKHVNDTFGHNAGDEVLVKTAEIVRAVIRSRDMFARWGGEEFVILQTETPIEGTMVLAERLRKKIEDSPFAGIGRITISLGVAQYTDDESIESFIKRADDAMYKAKREGKNRVFAAV